MKLGVMLLALIMIVSALTFIWPNIQGAKASDEAIDITSDLQILDVSDVFGGHITWIIHGELARELRVAIGEKYKVSTIDLGTASQYFKHDLERVIENNQFGCGYIAFVRILHSDPLHGDKQGILNDQNDVAGLVGKINSDADITIKMLIRGEPESGRYPVISKNLSFAPFYALVSNASEISKFALDNAKINIQHTETIAGFGSFVIPAGTFTLRLILGQFFTASGGWVEYHHFDFINSPLILFVLYSIAILVLGKLDTHFGKGKQDTSMAKKAKKYDTATKIVLFIIYIALPLGGLWYWLIVFGTIVGSFFAFKKIYGL